MRQNFKGWNYTDQGSRTIGFAAWSMNQSASNELVRGRRGFPSRIKFYRRYVTEPVTRGLCTCIRSQGNGDEICVALVEFHDHYIPFFSFLYISLLPPFHLRYRIKLVLITRRIFMLQMIISMSDKNNRSWSC